MVSASAFAPAKINLHLSVGPKRPDGFHDLLSLFHMIDLADWITVTLRKSSRFSVNIQMEQCDPIFNNTMIRAANIYAERTGLTALVNIVCRKRIPIEAGLGGGSSDGATVLMLMNQLCADPLSTRELSDIGACIGSDVPFFLGESAASCIEGRGEYLTALTERDDLFGLIIMPSHAAVSTARAFGDLDAARASGLPVSPSPSKEELITMFASDVRHWRFFNDFRAVSGPLRSLYEVLDALVDEQEELFGTLSGSGAAYCVLGNHHEKLDRFRRKLEETRVNVTLYDIKCLHRAHSGVTVSL